MTFLSKFFSSGIEGAAKGIGELAKNLDDTFTTSDREKLAAFKAETERLETIQKTDLAQLEVAKQEAQHSSVFVAGARPAMLWVGVLILFNTYILVPYVQPYYPVPHIDPDLIMPIILGMLGLGGMRTVEKYKGVARKHLKE